ncbi:MAG: class I SAM-dependent methyltransferase [Chloroflexota bacterium]|nr:class I SAM-dependent methyltransferase [Chloroflexota bacterium]
MSDSLRPAAEAALADWAARVRADREQVERCREVEDPTDFYAPVVHRFRLDPRRTDDDVLVVLLEHARPDETWLDVGAGGGRYALPIALRVREVIAVEPSPAMVDGLRAAMAEHGIANVRVIAEKWPLGRPPPESDVSLLAHLGYDVGELGPFLDALEAATRRLCIAVMGESAMTTVATLFWQDVHGERRVHLPALPELVVLLYARRRLPQVRLVDRVPPSFETFEEALAMARRQLWVREGSAKDRRLVELVRERLLERDGRFTFDDGPSTIGIASWPPRLA